MSLIASQVSNQGINWINMFILRVHSVDSEQPISSTEDIEFYYTTSSKSNPNPKFSERRGIIHLYRKVSQSSLPNPSSSSTLLFVVAIPNYFSAADFVRFTGLHLDNITNLLVIRYLYLPLSSFLLSILKKK